MSGSCYGPPHRCKELSPGAAVGIAQHLAIRIGFLSGFGAFPTGATGRAPTIRPPAGTGLRARPGVARMRVRPRHEGTLEFRALIGWPWASAGTSRRAARTPCVDGSRRCFADGGKARLAPIQ